MKSFTKKWLSAALNKVHQGEKFNLILAFLEIEIPKVFSFVKCLFIAARGVLTHPAGQLLNRLQCTPFFLYFTDRTKPVISTPIMKRPIDLKLFAIKTTRGLN